MSLPESTEFQDWLEHPITKMLKLELQKRITRIAEDWIQADFTELGKDAYIMASLHDKGMVKAYSKILDLEYDDITEESNEQPNVGG